MTARLGEVREIYAGWSTFSIATVDLPEGKSIRHEIEDHGNAAAVLPYDPQRRVATLVRQLRVPLFYAAGLQDHLEAPAGVIEDEDAEAGARREAMEETGLRLGPLEHVARTWPMPGISTERLDLFLAPYSADDKIGRGGGLAEENEHTIVVEIPLAEKLAAMLAQGTLDDLKTMTLMFALQARHPELFER